MNLKGPQKGTSACRVGMQGHAEWTAPAPVLRMSPVVVATGRDRWFGDQEGWRHAGQACGCVGVVCGWASDEHSCKGNQAELKWHLDVERRCHVRFSIPVSIFLRTRLLPDTKYQCWCEFHAGLKLCLL